MHGRSPASSLPALKRRSSPQVGSSRADSHVTHEKGGSPRSTLSGAAAASASSFGQPWTQPSALNSLSASLTRQQQQNATHSHHNSLGGGNRTLLTPTPTAAGSPPAGQSLTGKMPDIELRRSPAPEESRPHYSTLDGPSARSSHSTDSPTLPTAGVIAAHTTTAAVRGERVKELEEFVLQRAGRHVTMAERQKAVQKSLAVLPSLYPHLTNIFDSLQRYTDDVAAQMRRANEEKAAALRQQEQKLYSEFETFFEGKIKELVVARQEAEARAEAEHAAAFAVRKERDTELMKVKDELLQRLNECEHTEDQFRDFRHLIASVFQTNQQLTLRIDQLEGVLTRHRIEIPPASAELSAYTTSAEAKAGADGSGSGPGSRTQSRALSTQVPVAFIAAANKELVKSRLTLQQELLHSAFDDHSAYRLRIEGLTRENQDLTFHISELEDKVKELYAYIHQKRFITRVDEYGDETTPLTPRPREVPLALQTELGIELRHSTANILTELSTVAINMKHQLNSALLRARQLHVLSTWLNEGVSTTDTSTGAGVVGSVLQGVSEVSVIPVFPVASWPSIPHFLRTNVSPEVRNCFWTEAQIGCILYNFFATYKAVRARARFVRDGKMLAPRVYQLFEHRRVLLTRLDASKEDAAQSEDKIPFGYVVSQFAREVLSQLSPQNAHDALPLVLPGTISTRYPLNPPARMPREPRKPAAARLSLQSQSMEHTHATSATGAAFGEAAVEDCAWVEAAPVVELDWTRFTYNMWYAAMRYQESQPLCQLFMDLVDGRLPLETFDVMETVLGRVQRLVDQLDGERSRQFTYPRLVNGVVRWVSDAGSASVLRGVRAVVQAFETNHSPIHGGSLSPLDLFADETYCDRETTSTSLAIEAAARNRGGSFLPTNGATAKAAAATKEKPRTALPGSLVVRQLPLPSPAAATATSSLALAPLGATVFVRYWRSYVRDALEELYTRVEAVLCPLVEESEVVVGLYLLSIPRARAVLAELDHVNRQAALRSAAFGGDGLPGSARGGSAFGVADHRNPVDTVTGAKLVAEAADLLGVHGVARSFLTLLESRKGALQEKKMAEQQLTTETVMKAVQQLPRLKTSTHFPFRLLSEQAAAAAEAEKEEAAASATLQSDPLSVTPQTPEKAKADAAKKGVSKPGKKGTRSPRKKDKKVTTKKQVASPTDAKGDPIPVLTDNSSSRLANSNRKLIDSLRTHRTMSISNTQGSLVSPRKRHEDAEAGSRVPSGGDGTSDEGDLVEWYSLRHTIRQIMPEFPFLLFQQDSFERAEEAAEILKSPVLRASEESEHSVKPEVE